MKITKQRLKEIINEELSEMVTAGPEGRQLQQEPDSGAAFADLHNKLDLLLNKELAQNRYTEGREDEWYARIEERLGDLQELWGWLSGGDNHRWGAPRG